MFNSLQDPNPPSPTKETRMAVTRRARRLKRRQVIVATAGAMVCVVVVAVAGYALFATDDTTPVATEVKGATESNPDATSTTRAARESTAVTPDIPPANTPEPSVATAVEAVPTTARVTVAVSAPAGFTITGCTIGGIAMGSGPTLVAAGLAPGPTDVICDASTTDGAARSGRLALNLVLGENSASLTL